MHSRGFLAKPEGQPPRALMNMPRPFTKEEVRICERFAIELASAFKDRVASVILSRAPLRASGLVEQKQHIPLLVFLDDLSRPLSDQDIRAYLQVTTRLVHHISKRLHVSTLKLSEHWSLCRLKAPQHLDLLRYGVAVYDKGFFDPLRYLVTKGRIRPSFESEGMYATRADATLKNATNHMLQAALNLYWAGIDACHAALMKHGQLPPEPADVAQRLHDALVAHKLLEPEYPEVMRMLYELSRGILHRSITEITGEDYDHYRQQTQKLITKMERVVAAGLKQ